MPCCVGLTFGVCDLLKANVVNSPAVDSPRLCESILKPGSRFVCEVIMPKTFKPKTVKLPKAAAVKMPMLTSMGVKKSRKGKC